MHKKNIIAENKQNAFLVKELFVVGKDKEKVSLLDMSYNNKIFQVKMRQRWIIKNYQEIDKLKNSNKYKEIAKLHTVIKFLKIDVDKIKFSAIMNKESSILDSLEYQEFMGKFNAQKKSEGKSDIDLINEVIERNPKLFAELATEFLNGQPTPVVMKYIKEITDNHQYLLIDKTTIL